MYFSGIQPTGKLHIGNYVGAIKNWVKLQQQSSQKNIYCIADLHALTDKLKLDHVIEFPQNTKDDTINLAAVLLAAGIDSKKSILFVQSHVPQHSELQWLLSCIAPQSWLNKMTQYKDKKSKISTLGLFTYPVLMAADIILYQAKYVPVGEDQKQHVELTRDYVCRLNSICGLSLIEPEYIESRSPRLQSLRDSTKKMSKSDTNDMNRINLTDPKDLIYEKIRKAKTDSILEIYYDVEGRSEISNLLRLYQSFSDLSIENIVEKYKNKTKVEFKDDLAQLISNEINPIALRTSQLLNNQEEIEEILRIGKIEAEKIALETIKMIKKSMGLLI